MMRRQDRDQGQLFYEFSLDEVVPKDHLLRRMNVFVAGVLAGISTHPKSTVGDRPNVRSNSQTIIRPWTRTQPNR